MPARRHEPVFVAPRATKYSSYHDYGIDDTINRADYLSNAVLEDTYEAAARSRGKDHELLRNLNAAIVSTELHVNPRVAAVSRRVRGSSVPPALHSFPGQLPLQRQQYTQVVAEPRLPRQSPARPVVVFLPPSSSSGKYVNSSFHASKPVVISQAEVPWYARVRASSVPPESRFVRASSVPPRFRGIYSVHAPPEPLATTNLWAHRPVPLISNILRAARARSLEPSVRPVYYVNPAYQPSIASIQLWAHRPRILRKDAGRLARARSEERLSSGHWNSVSVPRTFERASDYYHTIPDVQERALSRYLYAHRGRFGSSSRPTRPSLGDFPQVYVPWRGSGPSNRSKAAVIGNRLDAPESIKSHKGPRSQFAANKLRELKREELEEGVYYRVPGSISLHASRPPLPKPTDRKSIRDLDGFTKPKNLLSWQYRVESRLSPNDLIYEPATFSRMRVQVRDVQERMDRQKQLLDRYLDSDFKIPSNNSPKYDSLTQYSTPSGRGFIAEPRPLKLICCCYTLF
ncbi:hypothetical protein BsWGS_22794 [Bradybaena similaris]